MNRSPKMDLPSEKLLQTDVLDLLGEGVLQMDFNCRIVSMNESFKKLLGYSAGKPPGNFLDMVFESDRDCLRKELNRLKGGYRGPIDRFRLKHISGEERWVESRGSRTLNDTHPSYILIFRDITETMMVEEIIGRTQSMASNLMDNLPGMAFRSFPDKDRTMDFISEGCMELTGYRPDELTMEVPFGTLVHEADRERVVSSVRKAVEKGAVYELIYRLRTREGNLKWVWEKGTGFPEKEENPASVQGFILDTTERKEMEVKLERYKNHLEQLVAERTEDLALEKNRLSATLSSIGDGVITTDVERTILMMNSNAEDLLDIDLEKARSLDLVSLFGKGDKSIKEELKRYLEEVMLGKGNGNHLTVSIRTRYGDRTLEINSSRMHDEEDVTTGIVLAVRDVTERRKMEEEASRNQRLESIGVLAGGIAHDFNNMLTSLLGNIALVKSAVDPKNEAFSALEDAEKAAYNARDLTSQLLTFSRGGEPVKKETNLKQVLRDCTRFSLSGSRVSTSFVLDDDLWKVELDEPQFKQALNNLLINAKEAMPGGGTVTVKAENLNVKSISGLSLREGRYVKVSIKDTGIGMPGRVLKKAFDPYFSTKSEGRGMGLATAFSIIREHFGLLEATSRVDEGSTFMLYLPALGPKGVEIKTRDSAMKVKGGERILLMDDDELLLNAISRLLGNQGYRVDTAEEGKKAVAMYHTQLEKGEKYHAVILDITVPGGMGGEETLNRIMDFDPAVKAIVSSGYSNDTIMSHYEDHGFKGVLKKPYKLEDLKSELCRILYGI